LGIFYQRGDCVYQDKKRALELYHEAAKLGNLAALDLLGQCYETSIGIVVPDFDEAAKYYQYAANRANLNGMYHLGLCYEVGRGVPQSNDQAINLIQKAADKGLPEAKATLKRLKPSSNY